MRNSIVQKREESWNGLRFIENEVNEGTFAMKVQKEHKTAAEAKGLLNVQLWKANEREMSPTLRREAPAFTLQTTEFKAPWRRFETPTILMNE
jgi:hypothetical protein